jgi:hypothetical protein
MIKPRPSLEKQGADMYRLTFQQMKLQPTHGMIALAEDFSKFYVSNYPEYLSAIRLEEFNFSTRITRALENDKITNALELMEAASWLHMMVNIGRHSYLTMVDVLNEVANRCDRIRPT